MLLKALFLYIPLISFFIFFLCSRLGSLTVPALFLILFLILFLAFWTLLELFVAVPCFLRFILGRSCSVPDFPEFSSNQALFLPIPAQFLALLPALLLPFPAPFNALPFSCKTPPPPLMLVPGVK